MIFPPFAARRSLRDHDRAAVARWLTEGGDERVAIDPRSARNAYGCGDSVWTGGATFSSTTASPLSPEGLTAACAFLNELEGARADEAPRAAAREIRRRLAGLCGISPGNDVDIVLAPSGTDLHAIAAAFARTAGPGSLVTIMPDPAESGRGVERAVRGLPYAASPPFARRACGAATLEPGEVIAVPLRAGPGPARPLADVDAEVETACERAARTGGAMLLVLLDVSKSGVRAPSPACAARLKARFGERLTVLVDACQFRLSPQALRAYLDQNMLVAVTGSKFLGGPPFSGALMIPGGSAERLRAAPLPWRALECSAREDWPEAYAGRSMLPTAFSLGPMLRWAPALANLAALSQIPAGAAAALVDGFGRAFSERLGEQPERFAAVTRNASATIAPILLRREGRPLEADAVAAAYARLRELAHRRKAGHLWVGQPVVVGTAEGRPLSAIRIALGAPHLIAHAQAPGGVDRLLTLADACLWEIARLVDEG